MPGNQASALQLDKVHASLSASSLAMRLINTLEAAPIGEWICEVPEIKT